MKKSLREELIYGEIVIFGFSVSLHPWIGVVELCFKLIILIFLGRIGLLIVGLILAVFSWILADFSVHVVALLQLLPLLIVLLPDVLNFFLEFCIKWLKVVIVGSIILSIYWSWSLERWKFFQVALFVLTGVGSHHAFGQQLLWWDRLWLGSRIISQVVIGLKVFLLIFCSLSVKTGAFSWGGFGSNGSVSVIFVGQIGLGHDFGIGLRLARIDSV